MGRGPGPEKTEGVAVRLLVVRHGNTFLPGEVSRWICSESDPPLTPQAKEQAIRVRELLKKKDLCPTVAYAGPLRRHQEFIGLLLEGRLCPWAIDERLQELDYGRGAGMKQEEIREQGELTDCCAAPVTCTASEPFDATICCAARTQLKIDNANTGIDNTTPMRARVRLPDLILIVPNTRANKPKITPESGITHPMTPKTPQTNAAMALPLCCSANCA